MLPRRRGLQGVINRQNRHRLMPVLVLLLVACAQPDNNAIRFGMAFAPQVLDPRFSTDAASTRIIRLIYPQLVDFDRQSRPAPALATWKQLSPTRYRFTLGKKHRRFHHGAELTSRDVKATYDSVLNPDTASPHRQSLRIVKAIRVVDRDTVEFELKWADPSFPGYLVIGIMPADLLTKKHPFAEKPVGSGPFRFHSWPDHGLLRLTRISDKQLFEFIYIDNATTRVLKLVKGEIDMLQNNLPAELVRYLETWKSIQVQHQVGSNFTYLSFNLRHRHLSKLNVRKAIAHAINRKRIVKKFLGAKTRLASAIFTPEHWGGDPGLGSYEYNPDKARVLLKQEGFTSDKPLELTYKTTNNPFRLRIATLIQYQLKQVGIRIKLRSYEWSTFYSDIKKGNFGLYSLTWVAVKSPDIFRYVYHSSSVPSRNAKQPGANRNRFIDKETDRYIETAEKLQNPAQRVLYYRKIHQRLIAKLPVVPLWYEENMAAVRADIKGYRVSPDGNFDSLLTVTRDRSIQLQKGRR